MTWPTPHEIITNQALKFCKTHEVLFVGDCNLCKPTCRTCNRTLVKVEEVLGPEEAKEGMTGHFCYECGECFDLEDHVIVG